MKSDRKEFIEREHITCECGYNNKRWNIERYGTCTRCGKVLDQKAKFDYEMYKKLRLWRKKFNEKI